MTAAASWFGQKVDGVLTAINPAITLFNSTIGAGMASAGVILKDFRAQGGARKSMMIDGGLQSACDTANGRRDAQRRGGGSERLLGHPGDGGEFPRERTLTIFFAK